MEQTADTIPADDRGVASRTQSERTHDGCGIPYPGLPEISRQELRRRLRDLSLTILDVHSTEVFAQEHLPRAINLPLTEVESRASEVLPDRQAEIAIYCSKYD